jgi:cell division protein FtsX
VTSERDLLVRIDERVKAIQEDIQDINKARACESHNEKIKTLERMVWGCVAALGGVGARILYTALR